MALASRRNVVKKIKKVMKRRKARQCKQVVT